MLPLLLRIRRRSGRVVRVGSGTRNFARWPVSFVWPSIALSDLVYWRDPQTARHFGTGRVVDLAFSEGDDSETRRATLVDGIDARRS